MGAPARRRGPPRESTPTALARLRHASPSREVNAGPRMPAQRRRSDVLMAPSRWAVRPMAWALQCRTMLVGVRGGWVLLLGRRGGGEDGGG
jgi:hypothetical protein